jgi:hypothetical protein
MRNGAAGVDGAEELQAPSEQPEQTMAALVRSFQ